MDQSKATASVSQLTLSEFLAKTNQERPEITGGCVLLTTATITTSMILMALKISHKRADEPANKRVLKKNITLFTLIQRQLALAADHDLEVFDSYRAILKSKSKSRGQKLELALEKATESLLEVCKVLNQAILATETSKSYTHKTVLSDVLAGHLILEAVYKGILALAEGNIAFMPAGEQRRYEKWKDQEERNLAE
jgi:formiminotetrahydrofolate cyclodeaminase